jgi:hypothetical protein
MSSKLTDRARRVVELAVVVLCTTAALVLVSQIGAHLCTAPGQPAAQPLVSPIISPIVSPLLPPAQTVADEDEAGIDTLTRKGSLVSYTIIVSSSGVGGPACLTDTLPDGLVYVPGPAPAAGNLSASDSAVYWNGDIAAGQPLVLTFQARLGPRLKSEQVLVNRARVSNAVTPELETNAVTTTVFNPYLQAPTALVNGLPFNVAPRGGRIFYTILITALAEAGIVNFTDTLPVGMTPIMSEVWSSAGPAPRVDNRTVLWAGPVSAGQPVLILIPARLRRDQIKGKTLVNLAHTDGPEGHADTRPVTTTIIIADIHSSKRLQPNVIHGRTQITSTMVLTATDGSGMSTITDTLPPNMTYVPGSLALLSASDGSTPIGSAARSPKGGVETLVGSAGYDARLNAITATLQVDAGALVTLTWRMTYTVIPTATIIITDPATVYTGTSPYTGDLVTLTIQPYLAYVPAITR